MKAIQPRLIHLTTADISLELLLGPQLQLFVDAGYEVIGISAPGPFVSAIEARGIRHIALEGATRSMSLSSDVRALGNLVQIFRELAPDIVHTHNPKPGVYGRIAGRIARVPVVVNTVHGLYAQPTDSLKKRLVVYALERLASTCSDAELVQNPEDVATLRKLLVSQSKITVLGNGVDLNRFTATPECDVRSQLRLELGLPDSAVVFGAIGRLVEEKGYLELFEAWETVHSKHPTARLLVVGPDDPEKPDALPRSVVEHAAAAGVQFLGMRDDVEDLYHAMDVYVLASHREGFPRYAMEAAASRLPLVLTNIRGCRQVVTHRVNGLLVNVRQPTQLANAMVELIEHPELRERFGTASAQRAIEEFDQESVASITLATYSRLLAVAGSTVPTE